MKKHGLLLILSASLLSLAACSGGSSSSSQFSGNSSEASSAASSAEASSEASSAASSAASSEASSAASSEASSAASSEVSSESSEASSAASSEVSSESSEASSASSEEPAIPAANGAYSYVYDSYEDRTEILGALEKYAVENKLTGLTLYGDGGYAMYNPSIVKGSNNYINGYGFGILTEGELTADLEGETNPDYARYYHTYEAEDPGKINYQNDKGSVVGDLQPYVSVGYFDTQMNETKDGYDWVGDLSLSRRPIAVNPDENGYATTYKIPVKVGEDLKYATTSSKYAKYNNLEAKLEDYVTPYKIYYTQAYGMARGNENLTKAGSIAGSEDYYNASKEGFNEEAWKKIGIKSYVDESDGRSYLEFTFNTACNRFYAMYYLTSSMFAPVPAEFITEIGGGDFAKGVANWGVPTDDETIVDHWLCTGPYVFDRWDSGDQIVFKKNANYDDRGRYKIEGVHVNILTAAQEDTEAGFKEFLAGRIHSAGIPSTQLEAYRNDPRTVMTADSSTYKLNMNVCDQDTWDELFGLNGTVAQIKNASEAWACEPAMQNKDFTSGLSFALDRKTFADTYGRTPSGNYFGNAYMSDPENGIVYNDTQAHKDATASVLAGTDGYGYSLEKAKASFLAASEALIEEGIYNADDTIEIEIAWQTQAQVDTQGKTIETMLESAFNFDENPLKLDVVHWVGASWSDVYYEKMMLGQFDLGFGSISGNSLNPLNFLEVLKSDNSSGFTLNWGLDTNEPSEDLVYDGKYWSFDALWTAADQGAYIVDGANSPLFQYAGMAADPVLNADGSLTVTVANKVANVKDESGATLASATTSAIAIYVQDSVVGTYNEWDVINMGDGVGYVAASDNESGVATTDGPVAGAFVIEEDEKYPGYEFVTVTFPADVMSAMAALFAGETYQAMVAKGYPASGVFAIDIYCDTYLMGSVTEMKYVTSDGYYGIPTAA